MSIPSSRDDGFLPDTPDFEEKIHQEVLDIGDQVEVEVFVGDFIGTHSGEIEAATVDLRGLELDGERVSGVQEIYPEEKDFHLEYLDLEELEEYPYAARNMDDEIFDHTVEDLSGKDALTDLPVVRRVDDSYQIIDGHKSVYAAIEAGMGRNMCRVEDLNDLEALEYFAKDHFPRQEDLSGNEEVDYSTEEITATILAARSDLGEDIREIDEIDHYVREISALERNF